MDAAPAPPRPGSRPIASATPAGASARRAAIGAIALITVAGGLLRLVSLRAVPLDPFYDAAVRSMSRSLHNFFFGAYEPGASVAIDKPPVDLWLQVISVKLFGFGPTALKLPQAFAGTAAVPLLYDALRRTFGVRAGLIGALTLALLPIAVLTARSDTMDAVMMLLTVVAFWCVVRYGETQRLRWLCLAAGAMGIAFNVKLFESFVGLPALALLACLLAPGRPRARVRPLALAGCVYIVVALSWLLATLATPASDRPYAIGSTNGSAWNAAFVFNGYDRIAKPSNELETQAVGGHRPRPRDNSELARSLVPIGAPSATRLFDHDGPLSGLRLGFVLLSALALGVPALIASLRGPRGPEGQGGSGEPEPGAEARDGVRIRRAVAAALLLWLVTGFVLFSMMSRLHPRYSEGFTPAVAAAFGIGAAWTARAGRGRAAVLAVACGGLIAYGRYLLDGGDVIWIATATTGALAIAGAALSLQSASPRALRARQVALATLLATALILPAAAAIGLVRHHEFDAGRVGVMRPKELAALRIYLHRHDGPARYELAAISATEAASLIVADARPVLMLTAFNGKVLTGVARLRSEIAAGHVAYALGSNVCGHRTSAQVAACTAPAQWIRTHGLDVSRAAGLHPPRKLWRLSSR